MTCEARRLLFDYYREKPRKSCPARLPRFFLKMPEICARPIKALRRRAFRLDGLITPTLKAAGSNPVGRTTTEQRFLCSAVFLQKNAPPDSEKSRRLADRVGVFYAGKALLREHVWAVTSPAL